MLKKKIAYRITLDAMFSALYVVLSVLLTVKLPIAEFSLCSLPILLCAFLLSPLDAFAVAFIGSFVEQMFYGLDGTFFFWMMPALFQAIVAGVLAELFGKNCAVWKKILTVILAELTMTLTNQIVLYSFGWLTLNLDNPVFGILLAVISAPQFLIRTVITATATPLLLPPLQKTLYKVMGTPSEKKPPEAPSAPVEPTTPENPVDFPTFEEKDNHK